MESQRPNGERTIEKTPAAGARLLLALLVLGTFANTLRDGFVWIDHWQVESGGVIARSWPQLWDAFRQPLGSMPGWEGSAPYTRPTVVTLLSLVYRVAGPNPAAFHGTLLLLHLSNVLLAYELLYSLGIAPGIACWVTAVFAVHPLQTAAVTWISGIADPLFAFFVLLAFRCELARPATRRGGYLLRSGALASFAIALGAKETAAVFPLLLAVTYACVPGAPRLSGSSRIWARVAPYLLLLVPVLLYRIAVLHSSAVGAGFGAIPLAVRLRTVPRLLMSYIALPLRFDALTVCDDYRLSVEWDAWSIGGTCAVVAGLLVLVACWRRLPHVGLGLSWMLVPLTPVLNIAPILHYRADRFFYLPLLGWALAVASVFETSIRALPARLSRNRAIGLVAAATVLPLIALTIQRNTLFSDDRTLFEDTLRASPSCREARTALGDTYLRAGRAADAVEQYDHALASQTDRASYVVLPKVFINLGMAQLALGNYAAAHTAFAEAHQLQPGLLHPLFGLGVADLALGRTPEAVRWLEQAHANDRSDPDVLFNLALGYERLGRSIEARHLYQDYLDVAPRGQARALAQARLQHLGEETAP